MREFFLECRGINRRFALSDLAWCQLIFAAAYRAIITGDLVERDAVCINGAARSEIVKQLLRRGELSPNVGSVGPIGGRLDDWIWIFKHKDEQARLRTYLQATR